MVILALGGALNSELRKGALSWYKCMIEEDGAPRRSPPICERSQTQLYVAHQPETQSGLGVLNQEILESISGHVVFRLSSRFSARVVDPKS